MAETQTTQPTMMERAMGMATSAVATALTTAQQIDEKYKVVENVQKATEAGLKKVAEVDGKYKITDKAKVLVATSTDAAISMDNKLGITATVKEGVQKAKQLDEAYGVSKTVTAKVQEADASLGISAKAAELDQKYGVSETAKKATAVATAAAVATTAKVTAIMSTTSWPIVLPSEAESTVTLGVAGITVGDGETWKLQETFTATKVEGALLKVTVGNDAKSMELTFKTSEDADAFVAKFTEMVGKCEPEGEQSVVAKE